MAEHFSEKHRNTLFTNTVTASLRQKPGIGKMICGSKSSYTGNSAASIDNRFGRLTASAKTGRNVDTDTTELNSVVRWIKPGETHTVAPVIDPDDQMEVSINLGSPAMDEVADAISAYHDDEVFLGFFGSALTGKSGSTAVPFKVGNVIAHSSTGLTHAKLLEARELLRKRNVNFQAEAPIIILQPDDVTDLMNIEQYRSVDYNGQKPLVTGELVPWLGFRFIEFNPDAASVPRALEHFITDGGSTRQLPVICPRGMHMGVWDEFTGRVDELPGKNYSTQYFGSSRVAATRIDEDLAFIIQTQ